MEIIKKWANEINAHGSEKIVYIDNGLLVILYVQNAGFLMEVITLTTVCTAMVILSNF